MKNILSMNAIKDLDLEDKIEADNEVKEILDKLVENQKKTL